MKLWKFIHIFLMSSISPLGCNHLQTSTVKSPDFKNVTVLLIEHSFSVI